MVKDHSDSEKGNPLPPHRLLLSINSKGSYIYHPTDRITHITAFVTPVMEHWLEREIYQWVPFYKDIGQLFILLIKTIIIYITSVLVFLYGPTEQGDKFIRLAPGMSDSHLSPISQFSSIGRQHRTKLSPISRTF